MALKTHVDPPLTINLTPMVDIVFLLIIFFLAGSKFTEMERSLEVKPPEVSNVEGLSAPPPATVIAVHGDGRITLDHEPIDDPEELTERLNERRVASNDFRVQIVGDAQSDWQRIVAVMNACRLADVRVLDSCVRPSNVH